MALSPIDLKTLAHPCYNCGAQGNARIHLPVAPKCNIQCNYCVRKYDCPNESRPGVSSEVLTPTQAVEKFVYIKERMDNLKVVGIAGPGDALANFDQTAETLEQIRAIDKDIVFCLSTNGLALPDHADRLLSLGVTHLTVTLNTVDPSIGEQIYRWVDYGGVRHTGKEAAELLLQNQLSGLKAVIEKGIVCKINCVVLKGINDQHIAQVAQKASELGAYITNIMPHIAVEGSEFAGLPLVSNRELEVLRQESGQYIRQMRHCKQCRADAIGTLDNDQSINYRNVCETNHASTLPNKRFAVASKSGIIVDQHFGHAEEFYIYESNGDQITFIEKRTVPKYCEGVENCDNEKDSTDASLHIFSDCDGVLALRIGYTPSEKLKAQGLRVITTYDYIESAVITAVKQLAI